MEKKKTTYQPTSNLTALATQYTNIDLSLNTKIEVAKKLSKILLVEKDCHPYKNLAYKFPKNFCYIYTIYLILKEKSDEQYKKVHTVFLFFLKGKWSKVKFIDICDVLSILLSTENYMPEDLKTYMKKIYELLQNLDYLFLRYPSHGNTIFPKTSDQSIFKKKLLLSFCTFNEENDKYREEIDKIATKVTHLLETPHISENNK